MAATPKAKPPRLPTLPTPPPRADRTSAVVTATLILLTALGVVTVFWEPLTALAVGSPAVESTSETRGAAADGGSGAAASPSVTGPATPPGAAGDASSSS